jgi:hypothetical protein
MTTQPKTDGINVYGILNKYYNEIRLSPNPETFTGRGNKTIDLNSRQLITIYNKLNYEIGHHAGDAMEKMVRAMTDSGDMSASAFLTNLYNLERNNWQPPILKDSSEILVDLAKSGDIFPVEFLLHHTNFANNSGTEASQISGDFLEHIDRISGRKSNPKLVGLNKPDGQVALNPDALKNLPDVVAGVGEPNGQVALNSDALKNLPDVVIEIIRLKQAIKPHGGHGGVSDRGERC